MNDAGNEGRTVLIVEDNASTAELERRALARAGFKSRIVATADDAVALLKSEVFSVVLLDYQLPGSKDPWAVLQAANAAVPKVPVAIVTGLGKEEVAAEAVYRGVYDYIRKSDNFYDQLPGTVQRIFKLAQADHTLARMASIVDSTDDAIIGLDPALVITDWNNGAEILYGHPTQEALGQTLALLLGPALASELHGALERVKRGASLLGKEMLHRRKDGRPVDVSLTFSPIKDRSGRVGGISMIARDISLQKKTEAALKTKIEELERMNRDMMNREALIIELKQELERLRVRLGRGPSAA